MRRAARYSYEELLRTIARAASVKPILVPVPFGVWHTLAWVAEVLPGAPVTRNQVELMQVDTVASPSLPGFADLGFRRGRWKCPSEHVKTMSFFERLKAEASAEWRAYTSIPSRTGWQTALAAIALFRQRDGRVTIRERPSSPR